jgi:hypothetical protein
MASTSAVRIRSRCRRGRGRWPCGRRWRRSRARLAPGPARRCRRCGIEVAGEEGVHGVSGMLGPHHDVHIAVICELPYRLGVVGQERWRCAEESLVPGRRCMVVADWDAREQVHGHEVMLGSRGSHVLRSPRAGHHPVLAWAAET